MARKRYTYEDVVNELKKDGSFEKQQINDSIKNKYAIENGWKLIRIPYWEFKNIEDILINELELNIEE